MFFLNFEIETENMILFEKIYNCSSIQVYMKIPVHDKKHKIHIYIYNI